MSGKLIVIEGTDCSGKETQSNLLIDRLNKDGINCVRFSFPNYDSPTGKIVGGPYLGKSYICDGWFPEMAPNVDPKISSLYFAADRAYNIKKINDKLTQGVNVVLDRYVYSNMAHQGGKIHDHEARTNMYKWLEKLEFELLGLPRCDIKIFLHMPYEAGEILRKNRNEALDQNENDKVHLINAEEAYLEMAGIYQFKTIDCAINGYPRAIEDIHSEIYNHIKGQLK